MADEDVVVAEVEAPPIEPGSEAIGELIDAIQSQNFTGAEKQFNDLVNDRLQNQLDQAKMRMAGQMFNGDEDEDLDDPDLDGDDDEDLDQDVDPDDESENDLLDDYEDSLDDEEEDV